MYMHQNVTQENNNLCLYQLYYEFLLMQQNWTFIDSLESPQGEHARSSGEYSMPAFLCGFCGNCYMWEIILGSFI